jgi:hypothetical protein
MSDPSDQAPRSAYEIAMERLRKKDADEGVERRQPTDQQKAAIAEVRSVFEARLAQEEVMHKSAVAKVFDPEPLAALEAEYRRARERLISERDAKIERIRIGEA